ncbi:hypothetical protein D8Y22_11285 [Salinadaptatus halalkaliphilus]|uniref:PadR family transcriptional regulator n=1 Tax=Salinadaptatus halalkaliphilus TaxID=2419781 RepID=A0A4S3TNA3_9EURY|nr:hypothetical protein [Salinadaptatus halalkaliphilus]THE64693.1 hypothetical protein D8Y22_11285 [Salinadaptatus halalkaliphilus]
MEQRELAKLGILGVLAETESATIESVHKLLTHNFGRYWGASTGILVPTMNQLKTDGYVEQVSVDGSDVAYRMTDPGRDHLQSLLTATIEDVSDPSSRPVLMIKLGYLHHLSVSAQREEIQQLKDQLRSERENVRSLQDLHATEIDDRDASGYRRELYDLRIRIIDALLEWLATVEPPRISEH